MADKKKKQAGRRAYLNDFHRDLTGAYIYDGSHFHFAGDGWKQVLLRLWALGLVLVVLVLAGGFSGEAMSHCVFQILPYLVEVGAVGSVVWALVRLTSGGETLRAYVYKATVQALPGRAVLVMCAARGRNTGNGVVHDRPRNGGTAGGAAAVPSAEGGASGRGMAAAALCADPAVGRAAGGDGGLMFSVCERRIAISVLFKYI